MKQTKEQVIEDELKYPGTGDDTEVNACLEKQATRELNNNPNNDGKIV